MEKKVLQNLMRTFLLPTLIGKSFILYFGINYSNEPGEGYGYGLIIAILITTFSLGSFAWKYRNQEEIE